MKMKIHTRGWEGDHAKTEAWVGSDMKQLGGESSAMLGLVIEIDGLLIDAVTRTRVLHSSDSFTYVVVTMIPGEVETITHTQRSWDALRERIKSQ